MVQLVSSLVLLFSYCLFEIKAAPNPSFSCLFDNYASGCSGDIANRESALEMDKAYQNAIVGANNNGVELDADILDLLNQQDASFVEASNYNNADKLKGKQFVTATVIANSKSAGENLNRFVATNVKAGTDYIKSGARGAKALTDLAAELNNDDSYSSEE